MDRTGQVAGRPGDRQRGFGRYTRGARVYDVVSLEWPIYRAGRQAAIEGLALKPGGRVLDVGCGTGLNFALLTAAVGPTGTIVGVDTSEHMLARAQARVGRHEWRHVRLVRADAGADGLARLLGTDPFDAVLFTYALSVIGDSARAWHSALGVLRAGGRVAVADLALPTRGWRVLAPLAWLACATGGAHWRRRVWTWVARDTTQVEQRALRGGHIRVAAGTRSVTAAPPRADR